MAQNDKHIARKGLITLLVVCLCALVTYFTWIKESLHTPHILKPESKPLEPKDPQPEPNQNPKNAKSIKNTQSIADSESGKKRDDEPDRANDRTQEESKEKPQEQAKKDLREQAQGSKEESKEESEEQVKKPPKEERLCMLNHGSCSLAFIQHGDSPESSKQIFANIEAIPHDITALESVVFRVQGGDFSKLRAVISGLNMDMGKVEVHFHKIDDELYEGRAILASCIQEVMQYRMELEADGTRVAVDFDARRKE